MQLLSNEKYVKLHTGIFRSLSHKPSTMPFIIIITLHHTIQLRKHNKKVPFTALKKKERGSGK
jgi:hypothetical protein